MTDCGGSGVAGGGVDAGDARFPTTVEMRAYAHEKLINREFKRVSLKIP